MHLKGGWVRIPLGKHAPDAFVIYVSFLFDMVPLCLALAFYIGCALDMNLQPP